MVEFTSVPVADRSVQGVRSLLHIDGQDVGCVVSREFLRAHFGAGSRPESWLKAYLANAERIGRLASERFRRDGVSTVILHIDGD